MEQELITRALAGDQDAYSKLYAEILPCATKVAQLKMGDHPDLHELPYDITHHALMHIDQFQGKSKLTTWVFRIAYNYCFARYRNTRKILEKNVSIEQHVHLNSDKTIGETLASTLAAPEVDSVFQDQWEKVLALIPLMPQRIRLPLVMFYIEGMPVKTISEKLGKNYMAVKSDIQRGREWLKARLNSPQKEVKVNALEFAKRNARQTEIKKKNITFEKFVADVIAHNEITRELTQNEKVFLRNRFIAGEKAKSIFL